MRNSALTTYEKYTAGKWNVRRVGNVKAFAYNDRAESKWTGGNKFTLNATNLIPEKYRPQEDFGVIVTATAGGKKCTIDILKTGTIYIRPSEDILIDEWVTIFIPYI